MRDKLTRSASVDFANSNNEDNQNIPTCSDNAESSHDHENRYIYCMFINISVICHINTQKSNQKRSTFDF